MTGPIRPRVLVLGAGFGGLELTARLADELGDRVDLTLLDRRDGFVFGFAKLDAIFKGRPLDEVRSPYARIVKPGVRFRQETIRAIDPAARAVETERTTHTADVLVVALGADVEPRATPGLVESGYEFYSEEGAERLAAALPGFRRGHAVVGVCATPFKCPPAPSEATLLLHDDLERRGVRAACEITLVMPFGIPVPPSPETSAALLAAFAERGIRYVKDRLVKSLDGERRVVVLNDGSELPCDLFLGVPKHRVPEVVAASGLVENGWIPVDPKTLKTRFPGVYAVGDVTSVGTPKAGVFAEGAARVVAAAIAAEVTGGAPPPPYDGIGACYVEFGGDKVGRVDVDFFSGPKPTGRYSEPTAALVTEKKEFAATRRARWFGA